MEEALETKLGRLNSVLEEEVGLNTNLHVFSIAADYDYFKYVLAMGLRKFNIFINQKCVVMCVLEIGYCHLATVLLDCSLFE